MTSTSTPVDLRGQLQQLLDENEAKIKVMYGSKDGSDFDSEQWEAADLAKGTSDAYRTALAVADAAIRTVAATTAVYIERFADARIICAVCGYDDQIGTVEHITGVQYLNQDRKPFADDRYAYGARTDVFWENAQTSTDAAGNALLHCGHCDYEWFDVVKEA